MQMLERPARHQRNHSRESRVASSLRATTLTALTQRHSTGYSREFMRETVMTWAAREWPELLIGRDAGGIRFEAHSPCASVEVTCAVDGEYVWSLKATRTDVAGRVWETCVLVLGAVDRDLLSVRTGYTGDAILALPGARQPQFLHSLVDHLPFEDGDYPLTTVPRQVCSVAACDNLRDHLLSPRRKLPILAVATSVPSQFDAPESPEPAGAGLARALCGLVHVVSLGGVGGPCLEASLGRRMAVHAGETRLFMPGLQVDADPANHPAFADLSGVAPSGASAEAAAQTATHLWSTSTARCADFEALWAKSGDA